MSRQGAARSVVLVHLNRGRLLNLHEELDVALGLLEPVNEQLDALLLVEGGEHPTQLPDDLELLVGHQDLLAARARGVDVDRREDAALGEVPRQTQLHVAGALELLEDHLVHLGTRVGQGGGEKGQRTTVLDIAGSTEETFRRVERAGVDTTGQDPTARRGGEVVGTAQSGDRVEQDDDVVAHLDQALCSLDGQLGNRRVVGGRPVEGRGDDLTLDRPLHVGDFLGTLVDQDHHEVGLRVVGRDGVGDRLQDESLARLGRADDQTALTLADRSDEVDQTSRQDVRLGLQTQSLLRVERGELVEVDTAQGLVGRQAVDGIQAHQRVELLAGRDLLALAQCPDGTGDRVPLAKVVLLHDAQRHVDVVLTGQIAAGSKEGVVVEYLENAGHRQQDIVLVNGFDVLVLALATGALALTATTLAIAAALTVTSATAGRLVILVEAATVVVLATLATVVVLAALATVVVLATLATVVVLATLATVVVLATLATVVVLATLATVVVLATLATVVVLAVVRSTALLTVVVLTVVVLTVVVLTVVVLTVVVLTVVVLTVVVPARLTAVIVGAVLGRNGLRCSTDGRDLIDDNRRNLVDDNRRNLVDNDGRNDLIGLRASPGTLSPPRGANRRLLGGSGGLGGRRICRRAAFG